MIVVLDCGIGNIKSVAKMIAKAGGNVVFSNSADDISKAEVIVFPGVGAFDNGISKLKRLDSFELIESRVLANQAIFIGICLGMQLLFESSEEGRMPGLGWIPGQVKRFTFDEVAKKTLKVPHMGWNIVTAGPANELLCSEEELRFYFVHTFYAHNVCPEDVMGYTNYGFEFVSAVARGNVYGVQFHPEKSHRFGLAFFKKFLAHIKC